MEVQVTITEICPMETIVSKTSGKEYHKYKFVGKTLDQYPKEICFETMGDDRFAQFNIMAGKNYIVSFDVESKRWKDKFFTSINAWRVVPDNGQTRQQPMQPHIPQPNYTQPMQPQQGYGYPPQSPMVQQQPYDSNTPF